MSRFVQDRVNPPAPRTISIDTESDVNCIALNKDCTMVAAAGRKVFKVYSVEEDKFVERYNLRSVQKINLTYMASDVAWSPTEESTLASASTNGSIVLWDLSKQRNKQEKAIKFHERAVIRLCFHSKEPLILSGSRDGVCKIFDYRTPDESVANFESGKTPVHDVQWWPQQYHCFASATENGSIQIWDRRMTNSFLNEFSAHNGPVFALDFHPEDKNLLASGGRDKLIKVWQLADNIGSHATQQKLTQQKHQVQAINAVSRIKWRPKRPTQIASVSTALDFGVNVWELQRPYLPVAMFQEHKDSVTSIIWKDDQVFFTGGKDSQLIQHSYKDAVRIVPNLAALDMNPGNCVTLAVSDKLCSSQVSKPISSPMTPSSAGAKVAQLFSRPSATKGDKKERFLQENRSLLFHFDCNSLSTFDVQWFKFCAKHYVLSGDGIDEMCQHNAAVARKAGKTQIMKHWEHIQKYFGKEFDSPVCNVRGINLTADQALRPEVSTTITTLTVSNGDSKLNQDNGDLTSGISDDDSDEPHTVNPNQSSTQDFFFEDNEIDHFELFDREDNSQDIDDEDNFSLPSVSFLPSHDLSDVDPQNPQDYHSQTPHHPLYADNHIVHNIKDKHFEPRLTEKVVVIPIENIEFWDPVNSVLSILHGYADSGDIQTAVSMLVVLGNKVRHQIDEDTLEGWITAYLDLLERFKLWCESTTVINKCNVKAISELSHRSTTVHTACATCHKSSAGYYCGKCRKTISLCTICHTPVKGVYAWCQGCAHGGHLDHLQDWFSRNRYCPTGCGHACELS